MACGLLTLRIAATTLGHNDQIAFLIIQGLLPWTALADLGLGQAIHNRAARGEESPASTAKALIYACCTTTIIGGAIGIVIGPSLLPGIGADSSLHLALGLGAGCAASIAACGYRRAYGLGKGWIASAAQAGAAISSAAAMFFLPGWVDGWNLPLALSALLIPQLISGCILLAWPTALQRRPHARLFSEGRPAWTSAIVGAIVLQVDIPIVAMLSSPEQAATYAFHSRLYGVATTFLSAIQAGVMPQQARLPHHALASYTVRYAAMNTGLGTLLGCGLVLAMPLAVAVLVPGTAVVVSLSVCIGMSLVLAFRAWTDLWAGALLAVGCGSELTRISLIQATITAPLGILLVWTLGPAGMPTAVCIGFMASAVWMIPSRIRRLSGTPT